VFVVSSLFVVAGTDAFTTSCRRPRLNALGSTTRRESFGDMVASALLPIATADTVAANAAYAEDDYPFKVSCTRVAPLYGTFL
jgi:hypothetical protein